MFSFRRTYEQKARARRRCALIRFQATQPGAPKGIVRTRRKSAWLGRRWRRWVPIACLLVATQAEAATRYINRSTGTDSGNGQTPPGWRTISYANSNVSTGDIIIIAANDTVYDASIRPNVASTTWIGDSTAPNKVLVPGATIQRKHTQFNGIRFNGSVNGIWPYVPSSLQSKYAHIRNCVIASSMTFYEGSLTVLSCRIGTDSVASDITIQANEAVRQDSCHFGRNVIRLRYATDAPTLASTENKLINWQPDTGKNYAGQYMSEDTTVYGRGWYVHDNKVRLTIPANKAGTKVAMWNRLKASRFYDNVWEVRDSSSAGHQWVLRDRIAWNTFLRDTFLVNAMGGYGGTSFLMLGSGDNHYGEGHNAFRFCSFWSDQKNSSSRPPFVFDGGMNASDSVTRCTFVGNTSHPLFAVRGLYSGSASVYRNTIVNLGSGAALEVGKNDGAACDAGWNSSDSLSVKGNILYASRAPFTLGTPSTGYIKDNQNLFAAYLTTNAPLYAGALCTPGSFNYYVVGSSSLPLCSTQSRECASKRGSPRFIDSTASVRLWPNGSAMDLPFSTAEARVSTINAVLGDSSAAFSMLAVGASGAAGARDSTADVTAPGTVADLTAQGATENAVILTWTAPGSDNFSSADTVASYNLRYSTSTITSDNFSSATSAGTVPSVGNKVRGGSIQPFEVTGLAANTVYYFALKATDASGNVSGLSNVASYKTARVNGVGTAEP